MASTLGQPKLQHARQLTSPPNSILSRKHKTGMLQSPSQQYSTPHSIPALASML